MVLDYEPTQRFQVPGLVTPLKAQYPLSFQSSDRRQVALYDKRGLPVVVGGSGGGGGGSGGLRSAAALQYPGTNSGRFPFDFDDFLDLYNDPSGRKPHPSPYAFAQQKETAPLDLQVFPVTKGVGFTAPPSSEAPPADVLENQQGHQMEPPSKQLAVSVDVCPDANCPHCLAIESLLQGQDSTPIGEEGVVVDDQDVVSPSPSHMDVSHGTPSPGVSVLSPVKPDVDNHRRNWNHFSSFDVSSDDLQGLLDSFEESSDSGGGQQPCGSMRSDSITDSLSVNSDVFLQPLSSKGRTGNSRELIKALSNVSSTSHHLDTGPPPPAYKLRDNEPPVRDKVAGPKAFGSNLIHLGNGMSLTENEVVEMPVHELNRLLYQSKLTEAEISLIKETRRRGKNKVAARNCRKRKLDTISELEKEVEDLKKVKEKVDEEKMLLAKELEVYKSKTESLTRFILEKVKYGSGLKLNVDELGLDKAEDGRLFIVPNLSGSIAAGAEGQLAVIA
eukprot:m.306212 g.306212  ORF g.306212 m.306212 type:complete len:501 (+) comp41056_c0_seq1:58-1560(+)